MVMFGCGSRWERNRHYFPLYKNQFSPNNWLNCLFSGNQLLTLLYKQPLPLLPSAPTPERSQAWFLLVRGSWQELSSISLWEPQTPETQSPPTHAAAELWLPCLNRLWWHWSRESSWPIFPTLSSFCAKCNVCFPGRPQNMWGLYIVDILEGFKKYWLYFYLGQNLAY